MLGRVFSAAAVALVGLLLSRAALAQAPAAAGADEDAPPPGRPLPRDDRTGRVSAFAGAGVIVPGGDLGGGLTLAQVANAGFGGQAGVAVGLTRYSGLELRGQFFQLTPSGECPDCQSQMFAVGLGLTYHAAQALAFDPWVRFGAGYRGLAVSGPLASIQRAVPDAGTFHGVDVASFTMGGDFYPVSWFGLGVFLGGDVGVMVAAPSSDARGAVYGLFQAGLRIALEPQRKPVTAASRGPSRTALRQERADSTPLLYNRAAR
jgi:hypothetical protein